MKVTVRNIFSVITLCLCMACSVSDDDGEGYDYPRMVAEMCDVHTTAAGVIAHATNDSDQRLSFTAPLSASWAEEKESDYRALLYYNKVDNGTTVQPLRAQRALVLTPKTPEDAKEWYENRDPLALATAWFAKNGKYLNLCLDIKNGSTDSDDAFHTIGLVCENTTTSDNGATYHYRLCHAQNDVPAYYTVSYYASIPTGEMQSGDIITLEIDTWSGVLKKEFVKP